MENPETAKAETTEEAIKMLRKPGRVFVYTNTLDEYILANKQDLILRIKEGSFYEGSYISRHENGDMFLDRT